MINKQDIKYIIKYGLLTLFFIVFVILVSGCSSTVENLRDDDFTNGCVVVESQLKLGYFNQEGGAVVCKLKCAPTLPQNFEYSYENPRTGCSVKVGISSEQ